MSDIIIPSSIADRKALQDGIREISDSMARADGEREYQKESIDELSEKFQIEKKYIRRMAVDFHKDSFEKKQDEMESYSDLYETIVKTKHIVSSTNDED